MYLGKNARVTKEKKENNVSDAGHSSLGRDALSVSAWLYLPPPPIFPLPPPSWLFWCIARGLNNPSTRVLWMLIRLVFNHTLYITRGVVKAILKICIFSWGAALHWIWKVVERTPKQWTCCFSLTHIILLQWVIECDLICSTTSLKVLSTLVIWMVTFVQYIW